MSFLMEEAGGQSFTGKGRVCVVVTCKHLCFSSLGQNFMSSNRQYVDTLFVGNAMQSLDLIPTDIHERSPIFLGSSDDVEEIKALYAEEAKKEGSA